MQPVEITTGKVYPLELPEGLSGNSGTFEVWDNGIIMVHMYATNITTEEVEQFNREPLKLWYAGELHNGLNVLYIDCCLGLIENVFNPKLYKDLRIVKFLQGTNTPLFFVLMEYETKVVRSVKLFNMKDDDETVRILKRIWKDTLESPMTNEEYCEWFKNNIWVRELSQMKKIMKPLGEIRLSGVIENLVFIMNS